MSQHHFLLDQNHFSSQQSSRTESKSSKFTLEKGVKKKDVPSNKDFDDTPAYEGFHPAKDYDDLLDQIGSPNLKWKKPLSATKKQRKTKSKDGSFQRQRTGKSFKS